MEAGIIPGDVHCPVPAGTDYYNVGNSERHPTTLPAPASMHEQLRPGGWGSHGAPAGDTTSSLVAGDLWCSRFISPTFVPAFRKVGA